MKSLTEPRLLVFASAALTIVIFALTGCAAGSSADTGGPSVASTEPDSRYCAANVSPHALVVKDTDGHLRRLVHSPGYGWRYLPSQTARNLSFPQVELSPVLSAHALDDATFAGSVPTDADPLAVFIDGPTGYTFTWSGEGGWRFVGHISDEHPE